MLAVIYIYVCSVENSVCFEHAAEPLLKVYVRGVRVFGDTTESSPPIIVMRAQREFAVSFNSFRSFTRDAEQQESAVVGSRYVTIEVDVQASTQPMFVVTLVHCDAFWNEDNNPALSDQILRVTQIQVTQAHSFSLHYTHRARCTVPNSEVQLHFSGNWKAKVFDAHDMDVPICEARFFVVEQQAITSLSVIPDAYSPRVGGTSPAAYLIEAMISAPPQLFDENIHTVTVYRAWRWNEPITITQRLEKSKIDILYNQRSSGATVLGFSSGQKRFRVGAVPAENEYRVLDIRDALRFPASTTPLRFGLSDVRRNGVAFVHADDGAFSSEGVSMAHDEYVPVEFVLASEGVPSSRDIYVVGSFNNWTVTPSWRMSYDSVFQQYKLVQWIRRGRHNYMYASGITTNSGVVKSYDYEECEGNSLSAHHTFYALFYYRSPQFGGYDAIIGVAQYSRKPKR
ncbi:MAG: DUF5103 domain-containing protein [Bacteroidota bacterium]|nr:DUF5103 domain-containing protein [Candidatus Kapabacteria bacterium]MDW8219415.1 DUF5103 domain-containing protein [Bacteroidota bacterium]